MLYEVCYRALSSIFVVEATHGRVARGAGGVLARPPAAAGGALAGARGLSSSQHLSENKAYFQIGLHSTP